MYIYIEKKVYFRYFEHFCWSEHVFRPEKRCIEYKKDVFSQVRGCT